MLVPAEFTPVRTAVRAIRESMAEADEVDTAQGVANYIYNYEQREGSKFLLVDKSRPMLFSAVTRTLHDISNNRRWNAHMLAVYGLNAKSRFTTYVTQFLESHAMHAGSAEELRRFTAFKNGILYISNYDGNVWRITGQGVTFGAEGQVIDDGQRTDPAEDLCGIPLGIGIIPNGLEVVFADDDGGEPMMPLEIGPTGALFKIVGGIKWARDTGGGMLPKHQALAMITWLFALAFPDHFPTKPLLLLEGAPGSGKSLAMQMIQAALHGKVSPIIVSKNGERDFRVALLRNPIAVLDNTDDYIDWMPNSIAAYTTGGGWTDRELHTNTGEVRIRPQSFVAVASKNPTSFRTTDVADRCIVLRVERRERFAPARRVMEAITRDRPRICGEWVYYLNRLVALLNRGGLPELSNSRMADLEVFAWAVGAALNIKSFTVQSMLDSLQRERTAFASENDSVVEALDVWVDTAGNASRYMTIRMLFKELAELAQFDGKTFLKTPLALMQRLRAPHVIDKFWINDNEVDNRGEKLYQIMRPMTMADGN